MEIQSFLKFNEVNPDALPYVMKQYYDFKAQYPDFIMFFRVGEFFETYFNDAYELSNCCSISITKRKIKQGNILMAGVPYKKIDIYIEKLIKNDFKVVIVDQTDEKDEGGYLIRKVTKTYTKGCLLDLELLNPRENNYLASIYKNKDVFDFCYADVSVGEIFITSGNLQEVKCELARVCPKEFLMPKDFAFEKNLEGPYKIEKLNESFYNKVGETPAHSALLNYMKFILKEYVPELSKIKKYEIQKNLLIDFDTRKNLEITKNSYNNKKQGSLIWALDNCKTPMGKRLLEHLVSTPLYDIGEIQKRQNVLSRFLKNSISAENIAAELESIGDILRLSSRLSNETITPLEFLILKNSLKSLNNIENIKNKLKIELTDKKYNSSILSDFYEILNKTLTDDIEKINAGDYIKEGASSKLDLLKCEKDDILNEINNYEKSLKEYLGINSLKIDKKADNFFIEVQNSATNQIGGDFKIIQKLKSTTRYTTDELILLEEKFFALSMKLEETKKYVFNNLKKYAKELTEGVRNYSKTIALLDVLQSFSVSYKEFNLVCPNIKKNGALNIKGIRHITAQKLINSFEPLDLEFKNKNFIALTGANGIGKSTLLKAIGITVILAQAGCFIPAIQGNLPLVDRLFAILNITDELIKQKSMHQVQMADVAKAIENSTENSLVLLDEIGKNTSFMEGTALFCAITKYFALKSRAKTIATTHFLHAKKFLAEVENKISFLEIAQIKNRRCITEGVASCSNGIVAAETEHLPGEIIKDAKNILCIIQSA